LRGRVGREGEEEGKEVKGEKGRGRGRHKRERELAPP